MTIFTHFRDFIEKNKPVNPYKNRVFSVNRNLKIIAKPGKKCVIKTVSRYPGSGIGHSNHIEQGYGQ